MIKKYINQYTLTSFLIGLFIALILVALHHNLSLTKDNTISLISIIIDLTIVCFIALFFEKRYSDNRAVKNYLVQELESLQTQHKGISNNMMQDKTNAKYIINWFKITNQKIEHINYFLKLHLKIDDKRLKKQHLEFRELVTKSDSFNDNFSKPKMKLSSQIKNKIIDSSKEFNHTFYDLIIKIHKS